MNESIRLFLERRSIRKYDSRPVPDEVLDAVLEAGLYAPSGMNTQGVRRWRSGTRRPSRICRS